MLRNQQNPITRDPWEKIQYSDDYIFTQLNFEIIIDAVESNKDEEDEPIYQGHKLVNYSRKKCYLLDHGHYIVKKIKDWFGQRYSKMVRMQTSISTRMNVTAFCLMFLAFWTATSGRI